MSELNNGLDKAASTANNVVDEGVGLVKRGLGLAVGLAKDCVSQWKVLVIGVVLATQTDVGSWASGILNAVF